MIVNKNNEICTRTQFLLKKNSHAIITLRTTSNEYDQQEITLITEIIMLLYC